MRNEIIISVPARNERKTALVAADDAFYKTAVFGAVKSAVDVDDNAVVFKPTQNILYRTTLKRRFRAGFGKNRLFTDPRPFAGSKFIRYKFVCVHNSFQKNKRARFSRPQKSIFISR